MNPVNGQPERITLNSIFRSFVDTFDVDKGFIKTYRLLTTSPANAIRSYLFEDRDSLTKPFKLLLISTAFAIFFLKQ